MSAHSPGPWKLGGHYDDTVISVRGGVVVDDPDLTDADLRLIAAAPELLAALKDLIDRIDVTSYWHLASSVDEAKAAIAKAEGQ